MPAFVIFEAASRRFALPASRVLQVLRAARPAAVAGAPPILTGVLDIRGTLLPVMDVRVALGAPGRVRASDQVLVVDGRAGPVGLLVDRVLDVREVNETDVGGVDGWSAGADLAEGAIRLPDGAVVVQSADRWAELARAAPEGARP